MWAGFLVGSNITLTITGSSMLQSDELNRPLAAGVRAAVGGANRDPRREMHARAGEAGFRNVNKVGISGIIRLIPAKDGHWAVCSLSR